MVSGEALEERSANLPDSAQDFLLGEFNILDSAVPVAPKGEDPKAEKAAAAPATPAIPELRMMWNRAAKEWPGAPALVADAPVEKGTP